MKKRYETAELTWITIGNADILTVSTLENNAGVIEDGSKFNDLFL